MFDLSSPDPHALFHRMREQAPVHRQGRGFWYLTRYEDVQRALLDPDVGRQLDRLPSELASRHRHGDPLAMVRRNVFNLDPPDHTRLRRLLAPAFGPRTVAVLERRIDEVVGELVGGLSGEVDAIAELALPLPLLIVADLLGFPAADHGRLRAWSDAMLRSGDPALVRSAGMEFLAYIEGRLKEPGEGLLGHLVKSADISHHELVSSAFQLLFAGDETTVNLIGNAVLELLRHPGQLRRLRERPELIGSAVEEVIRFNGPVGHSRPLYAMADVTFGATVVPRGDVVVPVLLAANRDPAVFPSPDVFDIGRSPNKHLGFGHGIHFCLGAALARLQARAAVGALVRRFPDLSLAVDPGELEWTPDLFLHGVRSLPLRLGGARS